MRASLRGASLILAAALVAVALCFGGATVAHSCHAIRDYVDEAFCVSRLRSVPGAASAYRHGHLLMAADLAAASGDPARGAAARMARGDPAARDALEACGFLYGVASVPALRLMRGYAAVRSWDAADSLYMLARQAGGDCDAALGSSAGRTMAGANREFDQLSTMATMLLKTFIPSS
ncbi:hypothetical protein SETIT_3G377900v2 [Setaria italica]|uniref:Pectinesterase inhibitor domain-containing protein n=1 Tax=Setaria italica TaxID=4555 RepID=A0A368QN20_SETIT|nr:uncharacterized protein LOC101758909 [Setaria italica]RCV19366.1 hypothetical protein SETIT_3G377900v2 [Setaria italica]